MRRGRRIQVQRGLIAAAAVPLLVVSAGACSKDDTTSTGASSSSTTAAPGTTTKAGGGTTTTKATTPALPGTVSIAEFQFSPATQTVKVGEKVTWTNEDSSQHQPKSDTDSEQGIDAPALDQNKTYSVSFSKAGTYKYHCKIHETMKGTIVVQ